MEDPLLVLFQIALGAFTAKLALPTPAGTPKAAPATVALASSPTPTTIDDDTSPAQEIGLDADDDAMLDDGEDATPAVTWIVATNCGTGSLSTRARSASSKGTTTSLSGNGDTTSICGEPPSIVVGSTWRCGDTTSICGTSPSTAGEPPFSSNGDTTSICGEPTSIVVGSTWRERRYALA